MEFIGIKEHKVNNFAGFKEQHTFTFLKDEPTVIFGINGAGKSSLLNSIYGSIMILIRDLSPLMQKKIGLDKATINIGNDKSEIRSVLYARDGVNEGGTFIDYNIYASGLFSPNQGKGHIYIYSLSSAYKKSEKALPIFRYFQSEKLIQNNSTLVTNKEYNEVEHRNEGYNNHYSIHLSIQEVTSFIIDQINIENQSKVDNSDLTFTTPINSYIRKTLNTFTNTLYGEDVKFGVTKSNYSSGQSLYIEKKRGRLEFIQLSSGEKYVFAMVLELIYRNAILNPDVEDLWNTPGIVLIDEIEDHLHPRWQLTIIKALKNCFPKVQFIISSHSSLIASSVRKEQIVALNNFELIPNEDLPNLYSGTSNELLNKVLFSDIQIDDFEADKKEIDALLNEQKFDDAAKKLEVLKQKVQANPKWIKDYERRIEFNRR